MKLFLFHIIILTTVIQASVSVQPVSTVMAIKITSFESKNIVQQTLTKLKAFPQKPNNYVIDLRSNTGGFIHEAIGFSALFVKNNNLITLNKKNGKAITITRPKKHPVIHSNRIVILINSMTASAAEAATQILKKHPHATVIGTPSHGKTSIYSANKKESPYRSFKLINDRIYPDIELNFLNSDDLETAVLKLLRKLN